MHTAVQRALLYALLWWILAEGSADSWGLGAVAVAAATAVSLRLMPPGLHRMGGIALLRFLTFFLWNSIRGGWQVAMLALRPRLDLEPIVLELSLALPPGAPSILMLGALGLMPGSVGMRLDHRRLRLHVLDGRLPMAKEARSLEGHIARLFGLVP
ncbi:MAG: hypothetical protein A3F78_02450 [Burkholderiales bacterium RIFCSPLOWO2_12_FULL_61_40]|nr:MAG: hypothetical protein A3F78_02450 [Burkholderiales bacterium RIFCSPLOWO2_12_FULL_61_40]